MTDTSKPAASRGPAMDLAAAPMRIGRARLLVRDLPCVRGFYEEVLGMELVGEEPGRAVLGSAGTPLLELQAGPGAAAADPHAAGLFHTAFLLPERGDLARWLAFVTAARVPLQGASDHKVSEAIYLADPEGNGIEVYVDRPSAAWSEPGTTVDMATLPLDLRELMGSAGDQPWRGMPAGSVIGHMHLQVGDTGLAERFYGEVLGFDLACRYPGGSFFGAGGYHHQLAANTWNSRGAGPRPETMAGLAGYEIVVRDEAGLEAILARAGGSAGKPLFEGGRATVRDPWNIPVALTAA